MYNYTFFQNLNISNFKRNRQNVIFSKNNFKLIPERIKKKNLNRYFRCCMGGLYNNNPIDLAITCIKELSLCLKLKFYNHHVFATWWCKTLLFQT